MWSSSVSEHLSITAIDPSGPSSVNSTRPASETGQSLFTEVYVTAIILYRHHGNNSSTPVTIAKSFPPSFCKASLDVLARRSTSAQLLEALGMPMDQQY
jgi:hypothetical protein